MPLNSTVYLKISPASWFSPPCSFYLLIVMLIQWSYISFFTRDSLRWTRHKGGWRVLERLPLGCIAHNNLLPLGVVCANLQREKTSTIFLSDCQSKWVTTNSMATWNILFRLLETGERGRADLRINYMFESRLFIIASSLTILFYIRSWVRFIRQHFIMDRIPPFPSP